MARELFLLRHGKANRYDGVEDYDRTLKKRGKRAAVAIGGWLSEQMLQPDYVISSPASRAYATAKIVCTELGISHDSIIQDKRLYDEGLTRVKSVLADCASENRRVLLVGHNPELEELLFYLAASTAATNPKKPFPTGTLARLALADDWSGLERGCAQLLSIIYPNSLLDEDS